ncbi:MAG: diguanylate cyclase [Syntrophomonadaceae bacterium]
MPLSQIFFWSVPIVALISYCLLALFMSFTQKDKYIRYFMLVLGSLIIWTAGALMMKLQVYPGVLYWNRIMVAGTLATPFLIYLFASVFTDTYNKFMITLLGGLSAAAIAVDLMGYIVSDAGVIINRTLFNGRPYDEVQFTYTMGPAAYPIYALMFLIIIAVIVRVSRGKQSGKISYSQIKLIVFGALIMFVGSLLNLVPAIGKYPVDILATFVNAILIVVAIYKYRMLELRFVVTKGLIYSAFAILLTVAYVYMVVTVYKYISTQNNELIPYITALSALVIAFLFQPLYKQTGKMVDKLFHRAEYMRRQALRNFSMIISNNLDLRNIADLLIDSVQQAIRANNVLLFMKNEEKGHYHVFHNTAQIFRPDLNIPADNPIVLWFESDHSSLSRAEMHSLPFFKSMWDKEKRTLDELGIEVIIPIKSRSEVIGLLMLTRKNSNTAYNVEDVDLLTYLGASTGVALDNARLYSRSQSEAMTDSLTKLHNHRYFYRALEEEVEKLGTGELSLLMIDLDLFKLFNDLYGHVEGDNALETVASILTRNVGSKGIVCRYGGEEFTVLLPRCDTKMAYDLAEKIRIDIEKTFFSMNDVTQRFLTASVGVCTYPYAAPNTDELLKRADIAMYTAKNSGKNKTVIYTPEIRLTEPSMQGMMSTSGPMKPNFAATIYALTAAIDAKDHYTFGHSQKVAEYATLLASKLSLDKSHVELIQEAALLHDIGKIGIPEHILTKTGRLTNEEFDIVKQHVEMSITIIKHLPSMNHVIPAVIGHHERWDGKGYPRGLRCENIPLAARCLAIADAFDAMTSNRPYRNSLTVNAALGEIENNVGTQFDPLLANIFVKLVREGVIKTESQPSIKVVS